MIVAFLNSSCVARTRPNYVEWCWGQYYNTCLNSCYWSWARCQIFLCLERHTNEAKGSIQCNDAKLTLSPRSHVKPLITAIRAICWSASLSIRVKLTLMKLGGGTSIHGRTDAFGECKWLLTTIMKVDCNKTKWKQHQQQGFFQSALIPLRLCYQ